MGQGKKGYGGASLYFVLLFGHVLMEFIVLETTFPAVL
jgi:hypothetical protein